VAHERGREGLRFAALGEGQDDELEAAVNVLEDLLTVLDAEQAGDLGLLEEHGAELLGPEVGVDARGDDDAALPALAKQVETLFGEELEQVDVTAGFLAFDNADLIAVLRRGAIERADVGIRTEVLQPCGTDIFVLEELGLLFLEVMNGHFLLGDQFGVLLEELLGVGLEDLPRRVRDDGVEAPSLVEDLVELVAPVEGFQFVEVVQAKRAFLRAAGLALLVVPGGLLVPDAHVGELCLQHVVENLIGLVLELLDVVAEFRQDVECIARLAEQRFGVSVAIDLAVLLRQDFAIGLSLEEHATQGTLLVAGLKSLIVHAHQTDEAVARQDVEIDVGQRLQFVCLAGGSNQGQEEAQLRDLDGLVHDVHAEEIVGDDAFLDEVADRGMGLLDVGEPLPEFVVAEKLDPADDGGVKIDEGFHSRHEERAGPTCRIEQAHRRQDLFEHELAEGGIEIHEHVANGIEMPCSDHTGDARGVHGVENQSVDRAFTEVFGDLGTRVIGSKGLLVDVLLEDIAQHIRVDLIALTAGGIVQVPRIALE